MKIKKIIIIIFWLFIWQLISIIMQSSIIIASPVDTVIALSRLVLKTDFWNSIAFTFIRITSGFFIGVIAGILFACIASKYDIFKLLIAPLISVIKTVPVVSFIIIALVWMSSRNLSIFISFLIVLPVIYTNTLTAIQTTDKSLLEMAYVFRMNFFRKALYIYIPQIAPTFISSCIVSIGLCWKAGTAAEVIGIPTGSIGEKLYQAKLYLETPELFAYTAVIVLLSVLFEKIFIYILKRFERMISHGYRRSIKEFR